MEEAPLVDMQPDDTGKLESGVQPSGFTRSKFSWRKAFTRYWVLIALLTYVVGLGSGYGLWGRQLGEMKSVHTEAANEQNEIASLAEQINPEAGYTLPAVYGDFGPKLVAAGAIDLDSFAKIYQERGQLLTDEQLAILKQGSSEPVVITRENQGFLLNLFWALGLANQNKILTEGPMMQNGKDQAMRFASTGGWTIAAKPVEDIFASQPLVSLTDEQQKRLEEVARGVYRPCCDNPTHFPDCNHGMAMLGLLELMASQDAKVDQMFEAAKYINGFWFPQQSLELAILMKTMKNQDFDQADARTIVGQGLSSGSGFQAAHQWLVQNGKLEQVPESGGSCGV